MPTHSSVNTAPDPAGPPSTLVSSPAPPPPFCSRTSLFAFHSHPTLSRQRHRRQHPHPRPPDPTQPRYRRRHVDDTVCILRTHWWFSLNGESAGASIWWAGTERCLSGLGVGVRTGHGGGESVSRGPSFVMPAPPAASFCADASGTKAQGGRRGEARTGGGRDGKGTASSLPRISQRSWRRCW